MNQRGVENLCNAIILAAVKDYRSALKGQRVNGREAKSVIAECERFFLSDWFCMLTNLDGEVLRDAIKREYRKR